MTKVITFVGAYSTTFVSLESYNAMKNKRHNTFI